MFYFRVVVGRRSHRYASFLRLAYEEIILRQYSRNLIFDALDDKKENGFYKGIKNEKF